MPVIYEPKGAALEYAELAINLYHGCRCVPVLLCTAIARQNLGDWSADPKPKKDILIKIEREAKKMAGDPRPILLCFTSDPYQSPFTAGLTHETLLILEKYGLKATVLTKAGMAAVGDFDILQRNRWQFGTSICCLDDEMRANWEPNAATCRSRCEAIIEANRQGISTWVSMEPVYDTTEALRVIRKMNRFVDFWKVGKMNHRSLDIDWKEFYDEVVWLLESLGAKYYIKKELLKEAGKM